ncbi:MAG TPA: hypothetical protein VGR61_03830, partial [Candidatus Dormibacteraeota bacterium]|nr:hypothetical protein [Candidatus Dormibacteraeota bacterium]
MRRDGDMGPVIFLVAMVMLGVAAAVVILRHPAVPVAAGPRHQYFDSPYQAQLFHKGQLHVHSDRAIGHQLPRDMSRAYERAGYEWVSITDLNTLTPESQFVTPNIVPVAGVEAGFPFGHLIELGAQILPPAINLQQAVNDARNQAAVAIIAHPRDPPAVGFDQAAALKGLDAIEIYDARLKLQNPVVADASDLWDQLLSSGHRVWGVAGDDTLWVDGPDSTLGQTAVWVQAADVNPALVGDAIRRGAFFAGTGVRVLSVDTPTSDTIRVI